MSAMMNDKELENEHFKRMLSLYYAPKKSQRQSLLPLLTEEQMKRIKQLRLLIEDGLNTNPELEKHLPTIKLIWWQISEVAALQMLSFSQLQKFPRKQIIGHLEKTNKHLKKLVALLSSGKSLNDTAVNFLTLTLLSGNNPAQEAETVKPFFSSFVTHAATLNMVIESALKIPPPQKTGRNKKTEEENINRLMKQILKSHKLPFGTQEGSLLLFLTGEILKICNNSQGNYKPSRRAAQRAVKLGPKPHSST
jgi:hypothetical protein